MKRIVNNKKINTKKTNLAFAFLLFNFVFSLLFSFAFAENNDVRVRQIVNNGETSSTTEPTLIINEPVNYSAGLAFSKAGAYYPIDYNAPIIFVNTQVSTSNEVQKFKEQVKENLPSGYFVPGKNEFVIVNNYREAKYEVTEEDKKDLCTNVSGVQTEIENGWLQNTVGECFYVLGNVDVITFSFIPEKYIYPVDYEPLRNVIRTFSFGLEKKNFIFDPNPTEKVKVDLVGGVIYITILLFACILFLRILHMFFENIKLWETN